jgi:hypothetical protein
MAKLLNYLIIGVGAWLVVSLFILGYTAAGKAVCIIIGVLVIALAFISIRRKADQWPSMIIIALGIFLILWGAFIGRLAGVPGGINEVVVGIMFTILDLLVLPFQLDASKAEFYNRSGGGLATITQIRMKDGNVLAKSVLLGAMPETIYMRPEEICKVFAMLDMKIFLSLPAILYLGWKRNRAQAKEGDQAGVKFSSSPN